MKNMGTKTLETERLILRKIKIEDANEAYNNWCCNYNVTKYVPWIKHENISVTEELFKIWQDDYCDLTTYRWIVQLKNSKELIGTIDVPSKKFMQDGVCVIGYCYGEKYWGKGYGTEALKAVIKYLFEECDADVIFAEYLSNNPGSGKVMKNAGMTFEGFLRGRMIDKEGKRNDLGSYSITKEEYFNKKINS